MPDWKWGFRIEAYLNGNALASGGSLYEYEVCLNFALLSYKLIMYFQRELQLIQCGSVIIGCLDNLNPMRLFNKDKIFDMCELSSYVTTTWYQWQIFTESVSEYLYVLPESKYLTVYGKSVCFPTYIDPFYYIYNVTSKLSLNHLWTDIYNAITAINSQFQ